MAGPGADWASDVCDCNGCGSAGVYESFHDYLPVMMRQVADQERGFFQLSVRERRALSAFEDKIDSLKQVTPQS